MCEVHTILREFLYSTEDSPQHKLPLKYQIAHVTSYKQLSVILHTEVLSLKRV